MRIMSHRFGTYKTLASTLESDILKNLKFIWNHSKKKKKKIVKERWLGTVYNYNYNVAIAFSGVNGELVPRFFFFYFFMRKLNSFRLKLEYNKGNYKARSTSRYIHVGWLLLSKMLLIQWNYIYCRIPSFW